MPRYGAYTEEDESTTVWDYKDGSVQIYTTRHSVFKKIMDRADDPTLVRTSEESDTGRTVAWTVRVPLDECREPHMVIQP